MGTRSLTKIIDSADDNKEFFCMYRQYDGYPDGHGLELAEFLKDMYFVNGIGMDEKRKIANGINCLAAQLVTNFKDGPGYIYLYPPGSVECGEEYIYTIYQEGNRPKIKCFEVYSEKILFDCLPEEVENLIKQKQD